MADRLTTNFYRHEFACKCGCGLDSVKMSLVDGLQEMRDKINAASHREFRININSGCRCIRHNVEVGGKSQSRHLLCDAADIWIDTVDEPKEVMPVEDMFDWACKVDVFYNGGIGRYPDDGFIHVDTRDGLARWFG